MTLTKPIFFIALTNNYLGQRLGLGWGLGYSVVDDWWAYRIAIIWRAIKLGIENLVTDMVDDNRSYKVILKRFNMIRYKGPA